MFQHEGGIREFVAHLNRSKTAIHESVFWFSIRVTELRVELALQWNDSYAGDDVHVHEQHSADGRRHAPVGIPWRAHAHAQ